MSDTELKQQFELCQLRNDADMWDYLAAEFYARGYVLNALHAWQTADAIRGCAFAQAFPVAVDAQ